MTKHKQTVPPTRDELAEQTTQFHDVFALENVIQLREAVDQAVYGETEGSDRNDPDRAQTVEKLTTLGQMGLLTETDLDEAKKDYL